MIDHPSLSIVPLKFAKTKFNLRAFARKLRLSCNYQNIFGMSLIGDKDLGKVLITIMLLLRLLIKILEQCNLFYSNCYSTNRFDINSTL